VKKIVVKNVLNLQSWIENFFKKDGNLVEGLALKMEFLAIWKPLEIFIMERMLDLNLEFMIYIIPSVWAKMKTNSNFDMERKCEKKI
jgi:hypothetical protein